MKVVFLGTNGWYDTQAGNTTCVLVETENDYCIFDAGNGLYKIDRYVNSLKPIRLFLSHYHLDHVVGLHILGKFNFKQGLDIYGPSGLKAFFRNVINNRYTIALSRLPIKVRLHEIQGSRGLPGFVSGLALKHAVLCYGYRVNSQGKVVTFCTDTGLCPNFYRLAKGADLLISECSFKPGEVNREWPHLNPQDAAKAALKSKVRKLALIHFDANCYPLLKERRLAEKAALKIFKNTVICYDDMHLNV